MIRFAALMLCATALALAPPSDPGKAGGASSGGTSFSAGPSIPANSGFSFDISPDKQALTLIFDNLIQEVEPARKGQAGTTGQTASQTKVVTINVPFATDQKSVRMVMDLRGFVSADGAARVRLIANAGDSTQVIDVIEAVAAKTGAPVAMKGKAKESYQASTSTAPPAAGKSGDFNKRVEFTVHKHSAKPVCPITLILLTEHDTDTPDTGGAVIVVDSLDLSFKTPGQAQFRR